MRRKMAAHSAVSAEKYVAAGTPRASLRSGQPHRRACARRAGANKSLSNCSLKKSTAVAPRRWRPTKGPALKPRPGVVYFVARRGPRASAGVTALFIDIYNQRDTGYHAQARGSSLLFASYVSSFGRRIVAIPLS